MRTYFMIIAVGLALLLTLTACQNRPFHQATLYDEPSRFVRIDVDPSIGGGHSHPTTITTDEMAAVLSGVMIKEPPRLIAALSLESPQAEARRRPAFNEAEIRLFAPLFAEGLRKAKPEEIITFGQTNQKFGLLEKVTSGRMFVTSGGMFIDGDELHLILGNYRSPTHSAPDPGVGDTLDGRSTPLQPIAPQQTTLYFEPTTAVAPSRKGILSSLFRPNRQEIVVLFKKLSPPTSNMGGDIH
jgi:hypothetical protein